MPSFVEVAIPVAVDRVFTYSVPGEFEAQAAPGKRVLVSFGRKTVTGLIVECSSSSPLGSLKSVTDVVDAAPVVTPELLRLCRWVAEYYQAPLGEVVKAALPHAFSAVSRTIVSLVHLPEAGDGRPAGRRQKQLTSFLEIHGPTSTRDLARRLGSRGLTALINELAAGGIVATQEVIPSTRRGPRTVQVVALDGAQADGWRKALGDLSPRRAGARRVLETLLERTAAAGDAVTVSEVLRSAKVSSGVVRDLARHGTLRLTLREITEQESYGVEQQTLTIELNDHQRRVVGRIGDALSTRQPRSFLLHGVTGSGKTQVYIEAIRRALEAGRTAIVLVPEISLTPQIVRRFKSHFGSRALVVHSRMSAGDRLAVWRRAIGGECRVVIGPRSAIFAPLPDLGLIVVDEEHESSYKQFDASPRYHARDVALVRGQTAGAVVVLGSATPSIESYHNALTGKYELLELPLRIDNIPLPPVAVVDMTLERKRLYAEAKERTPVEQRAALRRFQQPSLSGMLVEKIRDRLARQEGIILLQNRRGFAPYVICEECGHSEQCDRCSVTMTYHQVQKHLRCHYCGAVRRPPIVCPECGGTAIRLQGVGTQRVEEEVVQTFPGARVLRMDLDTTARKGAHQKILDRFARREADILLGTQMVAKGLDFPHVTLVGVISADTQMLLPDFRSAERTFQLLTQVSGRAGRSTLSGEVIIQTHQADHYVLRHVINHDFRSFFDEEVASRQALGYPPYARFILIETRGQEEREVRRAAETIADRLGSLLPPEMLLGPAPAVLAKIQDQYRWHLLLKSPRGEDPSGARSRDAVRRVLAGAAKDLSRNVRCTVDVDPVGML